MTEQLKLKVETNFFLLGLIRDVWSYTCAFLRQYILNIHTHNRESVVYDFRF